MIDEILDLAQQVLQSQPRFGELAQSLEERMRERDPEIERAPLGVAILDHQGRVTHHNRAFFPDIEGLIGKRGHDFLPDGLKGLSQLTDEFVLRCRQSVLVTHPDPRLGDSSGLHETIKIPLLNPSGRLRGILVITGPVSGSLAPAVTGANVADFPMFMEVQPDLWREVHTAHAKLKELSARQRTVVSMIAGGLKQEAISRQLDISRKTVEKHREAASKKLDARNYAELIRMATLGQFVEPLAATATSQGKSEIVTPANNDFE